MQQLFRNKWRIISSLALFAILLFVGNLLAANNAPDPDVESPRIVQLKPVSLAPPRAGWSVHGAWALSSDDPRLSGLSGLEIDDGEMLVVSDAARLIRMSLPGPQSRELTARFNTLRDTKGRSLAGHDSESLTMLNGNIYVGFEIRHRIERFDPATGQSRRAFALEPNKWSVNGGAEAIVPPGSEGALLILGESGKSGFRFAADQLEEFDILGASGRITGAARIDGDRIILLHRDLGLGGFSSAIALAKWRGGALHVGPAIALPISRFANMEGLAAAPIAGGSRIWILSDDNRAPYLRQWLVAYDVKADAWP